MDNLPRDLQNIIKEYLLPNRYMLRRQKQRIINDIHAERVADLRVAEMWRSFDSIDTIVLRYRCDWPRSSKATPFGNTPPDIVSWHRPYGNSVILRRYQRVLKDIRTIGLITVHNKRFIDELSSVAKLMRHHFMAYERSTLISLDYYK